MAKRCIYHTPTELPVQVTTAIQDGQPARHTHKPSEVVPVAKQNPEAKILNPAPDAPLRNERELCRLVAEVLIRKHKRLTEEQEVQRGA